MQLVRNEEWDKNEGRRKKRTEDDSEGICTHTISQNDCNCYASKHILIRKLDLKFRKADLRKKGLNCYGEWKHGKCIGE